MSPNYNVQHRNDGQLLPIKAPQPFSESHWWHIMLISGLGPALEAIYNTLMQRSQIQYFYSLKALLHSLTNLSVGAPTSTNPLHSSELKRITTRHRSTLIKVRSSASSVGIGPAHARGSRSFSLDWGTMFWSDLKSTLREIVRFGINPSQFWPM
jgi:hypothetical protein